MPTFEITEVESEFSTWTAKKGPAAGQEFRSYKIRAKGPDGEERDFEINRKPNSGPPPLGAVEAEVQPSNGNFPDKLKLTPQGRSGGSSGGFAPDPERSRRIERQHSQEMALRFMTFYSDSKPYETQDELKEVIKHWTDWFQADLDADGGGVPASQANGGRADASLGYSSAPAATVSAERIGFASDKQRDFFERLLKDAGLTSQQVAEVNRYVTEALATDRVSKAIDAIKEGDRDKAIEALLQQSLEWHKKQSDVPFDDGGLPPLREHV